MGDFPGDHDPRSVTAFDALGVLATQDAELFPGLRHLECFTARGLLTVLWHEPAVTAVEQPVAVIAVGGAMGGVLGPGRALYQHLGTRLAAAGVPVLRVGYRRPNDLDACCLDVAAVVQLAAAAGAERVVVCGHSFGGAVVIRAAVARPETVVGVVTFATQSAGCEVAAGLAGRPLLMFHGAADELLPAAASEMVRQLAGSGELVILPGEGHLLSGGGPRMWSRLATWLPETLGVPIELGEHPR